MKQSTSSKTTRELDSNVLLERLDTTTSSRCVSLHHEPDGKTAGDLERGDATATPIGLDLSIRFGRLSALIALAVSVLVALTLTFNHGVIIGDFDPVSTDADAQKKLLDDYNSYTANVASLLGRPVEIFVALAVHVLLLRVLATSLLGTEISWKTDAFMAAIGAGVGYLIFNGLNALNVQPQPPIIKPVISAADLTYVANLSMSDAALRSTNLTQSFSERSPRNPITNTLLRNLVLPRVPAEKARCTTYSGLWYPLPYLVPEYGFSQRDWQSRLLQEAPEPKQLRVVVNPSNTTANYSADSGELPMDTSLAADLFLYSMFAMPDSFGWTREANFVTEQDLIDRNPTKSPGPAARIFGFTPPVTSTLDETAQREWLLRTTSAALARKLGERTTNTSQSDIVMEFSHVDISPTMRFDALTIDIEVDPLSIADAKTKDNATRYFRVERDFQCGPWPMRCLLRTPNRHLKLNDGAYDPPAQVQVYGTCVNANGTEELYMTKLNTYLPNTAGGIDCRRACNTSLMVMSVGKRFVAESLTPNKTANASGVFDNPEQAVVKNLRRIYSFTIAKLSWELSDLTTEYHAECAQDAGGCQGLRFPLAPASTSDSRKQELVVGSDALPMNLIPQVLSDLMPAYLPLIQLHEPSQVLGGDFREDRFPLAADTLLPHNIANVTWDLNPAPINYAKCASQIEDRLQLILNNHMYIEHGLQTAYTAATFFLLQNGVVKDVIALNATENSLNFEQNTQVIKLLASIPDQNAWLTLSGCFLLVLSLCCIVVWAWATSDATSEDRLGGLGHVATPHVVARVLLDSEHFPPMFLHRRVVGVRSDTGAGNAMPGDGFVIDGLSLQTKRSSKQGKEEVGPSE